MVHARPVRPHSFGPSRRLVVRHVGPAGPARLDRLKGEVVSLHMVDLGGDVTGNGISQFVFTILSGVAEAERDRTRERIRDVKRDQKARKRYLGGAVPFGWQVGPSKELIEEQKQQRAISRMVKMREAGKSLRTIAAAMEAQGFKLSHFGVRKIIDAASNDGPTNQA
jgi:putative DNA-invertase from lambdoid prophage Rac